MVKFLIKRSPHLDEADTFAQFRYGVCETEDKDAIKVLKARHDVFHEGDPDFAAKLAHAQGVLPTAAIQAAIDRPSYNCAWCIDAFRDRDSFVAHAEHAHGISLPVESPVLTGE